MTHETAFDVEPSTTDKVRAALGGGDPGERWRFWRVAAGFAILAVVALVMGGN